MFCINCGKELTEKDVFCKNCGFKNNLVKSEEKIVEKTEPKEEMVETIEQVETKEEVASINIEKNDVIENSNQQNENDINKVQENNEVELTSNASVDVNALKKAKDNNSSKKKFKKWIFIIIGIIVLLVCAYFIYIKFFKEEKVELPTISYKLEWDETSDIKYDDVSQSRLKVVVNATPKKHVDDIKYATNCGKVRGTGSEVAWDLTKATGKCTIIAFYHADIITKTINVYPNNIEEENLSINYEIDEDSDDDIDGDGLSNKEEKKNNTNPELIDTDMDGLDDGYEINESKTDPNKADSDNDGLSDYDEIELNLDPNVADSKGDGVKDGERTLTYEFENDKLKVKITGKGNIASLVTDVNPNTKISSKEGLINNLYTFYTDGKMDEAVVTIRYTDEELKEKGLNEDNLSLYYYNEKENKYEKIDSKVDKENKTVTATLKHFSMYVLGDSEKVKEETSNQVIFIIDNSWSMYSNEQYKQYTGEEYTGGLFSFDSKLDASDEDGVRFTLTQELSKRLYNKNYEIGISEFRNDYAKVLPIGSNIDDINKSLNNMMGVFVTTSAGTNSSNALYKAIDEFDDDTDNKIIVILTDGEDTYTTHSNDVVINKAKENGVKICAIGFGEGSYNDRLARISSETGCQFYGSRNVEGLTELFSNIGSEIDDGFIDVDNDGKADGIKIADSGFQVNRDGFSFSNYATTASKGGHCYGMATFAELYYTNSLPTKLDTIKINDDMVYGFDLTGTYFEKGGNLYDYEFKSDILKYFSEYEKDEYINSIRKVVDGDLVYTDDYKKKVEDTELYMLDTETSGLSEETQMERFGFTYKNYEQYYLSYDRIQIFHDKLDNNDKQLLNAFYYLFLKQTSDEKYASGDTLLTSLRNYFGAEVLIDSGRNVFLTALYERLSSKDPVVLSSTFDGGFGQHAINAIDLSQDIDNPNIYYIGVYDNNYPNEKRYVTIKCKKDSCLTVSNNYYSGDETAIRITPSLQYDIDNLVK